MIDPWSVLLQMLEKMAINQGFFNQEQKKRRENQVRNFCSVVRTKKVLGTEKNVIEKKRERDEKSEERENFKRERERERESESCALLKKAVK